MINDVVTHQLKLVADERGWLMEVLREDWELFERFGQAYITAAYPQVVKAWHMHKKQTDNIACIKGMVKLVLYDDRADSPTRGEVLELFLGPDNYQLVSVPARVWNGFKGLGGTMSIVANCATIPHDPKEIIYKDPFSPDIPYHWEIKHR